MQPSYRILMKTALDLQSALLLAACDAASRGIAAAANGRPAGGLGRVGAFIFLAELDRARGRRRYTSDTAAANDLPGNDLPGNDLH